MWRDWMERTLDVHGVAEYAACRAAQPSVDDAERVGARETIAQAAPGAWRLRADPLVEACG
jgi:hypothetical protein